MLSKSIVRHSRHPSLGTIPLRLCPKCLERYMERIIDGRGSDAVGGELGEGGEIAGRSEEMRLFLDVLHRLGKPLWLVTEAGSVGLDPFLGRPAAGLFVFFAHALGQVLEEDKGITQSGFGVK